MTIGRPAPRPDRARGQKQHHERTRFTNQTTKGDSREQIPHDISLQADCLRGGNAVRTHLD